MIILFSDVIIKNQNNHNVISENYKRANSLKDKLLGLLRTSNPRCLVFKTRFGIHTFGLYVPIDILILNSNHKVVKMKINLSPNRVYLWNPKYSTIIELPSGSIHKSQTEIGHTIKFLS